MQRSTIYYQGISHALHTICRDEGFRGLYKGLGATLLVTFQLWFLFIRCSMMSVTFITIEILFVMQGVGPSIAISFSVYETLRSYWHAQRWGSKAFLIPNCICLLLSALVHDFWLFSFLTLGLTILLLWLALPAAVFLVLHHQQVCDLGAKS